jgi:hypothetical protein
MAEFILSPGPSQAGRFRIVGNLPETYHLNPFIRGWLKTSHKMARGWGWFIVGFTGLPHYLRLRDTPSSSAVCPETLAKQNLALQNVGGLAKTLHKIWEEPFHGQVSAKPIVLYMFRLGVKPFVQLSTSQMSMDCFKGHFTGKSHDLHGKIPGFRLRFYKFTLL